MNIKSNPSPRQPLGDIHDLGDLLEQLRTRHKLFYYVATILSALGILGVLCLIGVGR